MSNTGKSTEAEIRLVVLRGWGEGENGEGLLMGVEFLSGVLKMFCVRLVDGHATLNAREPTELYTRNG